jgi:hypothetical protein
MIVHVQCSLEGLEKFVMSMRIVRSFNRSCLIAAVAAMATSGPAPAVSQKVEDACRDDYFRHCSAYSVGTSSLRLCMESKASSLTRSCVRALIDAGVVDRRRLKK